MSAPPPVLRAALRFGGAEITVNAMAATAHLRHECRRVDIPPGRLAAELVAQTGEPTRSEPR